MKNLIERTKEALKYSYADLFPEVTEEEWTKYARVLIRRATRFYMWGKLDLPTVQEDLYAEDGELVNLEYSSAYEDRMDHKLSVRAEE